MSKKQLIDPNLKIGGAIGEAPIVPDSALVPKPVTTSEENLATDDLELIPIEDLPIAIKQPDEDTPGFAFRMIQAMEFQEQLAPGPDGQPKQFGIDQFKALVDFVVGWAVKREDDATDRTVYDIVTKAMSQREFLSAVSYIGTGEQHKVPNEQNTN